MEIELGSLEINISTTGGSVLDGFDIIEQIKNAESEGRQVKITIDSSGATAAKMGHK